MTLLELSQDAYLASFFIYCLAFILFVFTMAGTKMKVKDTASHVKKWGNISFAVTIIGFVSQLIYFATRWIGGGHIPVSNMYEFMSFLAMMIIAAFLVMFMIYRSAVLGVFAVPLAFIIMAYASVFPSEVQPLIPSLDSIWMILHVSLAAIGYAFFAVGFVVGLMYLLRTVRWDDVKYRTQQRWLEFVLIVVVITIGYIFVMFGFRAVNYEVSIGQKVDVVENGQITSKLEMVKYEIPPLIAPHNSDEASLEAVPSLLGLSLPLVEAPGWMEGVHAGRKLNTVVFSIIAGLLLYALIRLIIRKPIARAIHPMLQSMDPDDLDEISYRANAIGFPIFTLGGLIFAMIWAHIAWSRFWGWDPKEVWALVTWLFYSAYLHLRLSRGWHGTKSSWLAVIGFMIVLFTLLGVNLIIAGLHSYSGV
ncbi:c-type cytochrome biogenesis protein CcsB [Paenibacillus sp. 481]|uniref:c-type cytochrome biogenesis protein CcsB n=1 Tax=Paenibacillus sp. 481 TaxID=2835869 RepID=UPI001E4788EF|nr:c-type cytochrome biogenesis protein CcsB [Paenibacillus sp. 481]UHA72932.1 c-type cytochrome biogenesis protein CcsB [Paenibacillus sp. 481]